MIQEAVEAIYRSESRRVLATLLRLTERFCVVFQTLRTPPEMSISCSTPFSTHGHAARA